MKSESFIQSGLFENAVCCVAGFYFAIDGERAGSYRTEPDIMIAFSVALEITPGLFEQALYLGGKIVHLTRLGEGVTLGEKVEGNARMFAAGDNAVLPQQLRNHNLKLSLKFFRSLGLSNKPWHVIA